MEQCKRVLITGLGSYIGTSFEKWVTKFGKLFFVDTVSTLNNEWRNKSFSGYDVVFHVAGIAHTNAKSEMEQLYYKINRDLAIDVARKSKHDGVRQFIFMSSIIVYGDSSAIGEKRIISKDTMPAPTSFYGNSKLEAEKGILPLQSEKFNVVILRPPMIYGKGSRGNYPLLAKLARRCPVFPEIDNLRSMLYIDNLCEFVKQMIQNKECGIFYPQNSEYSNTTELVKLVASVHGKKVLTTKLFNPIIRMMSKKLNLINKIFGSLVYDKDLSGYHNFNYCIFDLKESISLTEQR